MTISRVRSSVSSICLSPRVPYWDKPGSTGVPPSLPEEVGGVTVVGGSGAGGP